MRSIPFFTTDIKIKVHSATREEHVNRIMTIEEFANGAPVSLYELENGDLFCVVPNKRLPGPDRFIEGPEV